MKFLNLILIFCIALLTQCNRGTNSTEFDSVSKVKSGKAVTVVFTSYSTTLLANGSDHTKLRIVVADSIGREITSAVNPIRVYISGDGSLADADGKKLTLKADTSGKKYADCKLEKGICHLQFIAGTHPDKIVIEARSGKLWPGSHEIHTLPRDFKMMKPRPNQLPQTKKTIDRMIGADISFLLQLEDQVKRFYVNGRENDAIKLLHDHGFNYIRLRIFVNPEDSNGYSPHIGYCGLQQTLAMAKRVNEAGMKLLLDFHYSDYWADPQKQTKPRNWKDLPFELLKDSVRAYTTKVLLALKEQGTLPAMVQVGNEINHGILWTDGHISNPDQLAGLLKAGVEGVKAVDTNIPVMMHLALGGQNEEAVFWLDNMIARGVQFDIIGLSYYPRWHGTLYDLKNNLLDLIKRYNKPVNVVEYSDYKKEVNDIVFGLPDNMGKGSCIWEPLNSRSGLFDKNGSTTKLFSIYDQLKESKL